MKRYKPIKQRSDKGRLITKIDKLFRETVLSKREHKCEWCGKSPETVFISHILPKGKYPRLRFVEDNVLLLCYYCHMERWHKNPLEAEAFIMEKFGKDYRKELLIIEKTQDPHTMFYLYCLHDFLKGKFDGKKK